MYMKQVKDVPLCLLYSQYTVCTLINIKTWKSFFFLDFLLGFLNVRFYNALRLDSSSLSEWLDNSGIPVKCSKRSSSEKLPLELCHCWVETELLPDGSFIEGWDDCLLTLSCVVVVVKPVIFVLYFCLSCCHEHVSLLSSLSSELDLSKSESDDILLNNNH